MEKASIFFVAYIATAAADKQGDVTKGKD